MAQDVVVVTGSSGLIGSRVVRRLAREFAIVGFDRAGDPHPPVEAECVCVDLESDESVRTGLARVRYAHGERLASVVHLAAYYDFSGAPSPLYRRVTVEGTKRLLRGLQEFEVEQFIFSSTMLVHAPVEPGSWITEDSPIGPTWPYPASKVATEEAISSGRGAIPAVLLRIAGVYDDMGHSPPLTNQIRRIYERRLASRVYPGHLDRGSAFVHLDDAVDAIASAVRHRDQLPPEVPILIGEDETMAYGDLQREIGCLLYGQPWSTYVVPKPVAKAGAWLQEALPFMPERFVKPWMIERSDDHFALDTTRARTLLDWSPQHRVHDALPVMIERLIGDPAAWYHANRFGAPPSDASPGSGDAA